MMTEMGIDREMIVVALISLRKRYNMSIARKPPTMALLITSLIAWEINRD